MSSLVRKIQKRIMKAMNVEKVPCPYGRTYDTGLIAEDGKPIIVPVLVYPRLAPAGTKAQDVEVI